MVRTLLGKPRALRPLQATDLAVTDNYKTDGFSEAKDQPGLWSSSHHSYKLYQNKQKK